MDSKHVVTLFEHQRVAYSELGWGPDHPILGQLEALNESVETEIFRLGRKYLRARQFVGVVRVGNVVFQVLPKIDYERDGDPEAMRDTPPYEEAVKSATANLLYLLSYTYNLKIRAQDVAELSRRTSDWFELLTRLFAMNLFRLMQGGPEREYVTVEETRESLKGCWLLSQQLKRRPYEKHQFDIRYDEFSQDTPLNQVFRFVVEQLLFNSWDRENRRLLGAIRKGLSDVSILHSVSEADLNQVYFTRLNERFRPVYSLARLFMEHSTIQLSVGEQAAFAFVFDMNRLFEEFVAGYLSQYRRQILPAAWAEVRMRRQARGTAAYLVRLAPDGRRLLRLYPDLMLVQPSGTPVAVVDTKYKSLDGRQRNLRMSESDVYQMLAYSSRFGSPRTLLLYPQIAGAPRVLKTFKFIGELQGYLTVASLDLRQPLNQPEHLSQEFRLILEEVLHYGSLR